MSDPSETEAVGYKRPPNKNSIQTWPIGQPSAADLSDRNLT